jgi:hypothetical protein
MTVADNQSRNVRGAAPVSLSRVLNVTANVLIAWTVVAETLRFMLLLNNPAALSDQPQALQFLLSSVVTTPGIALAFVKCLLNLIRAFTSSAARGKALLFLLIVVWSLLMPIAFHAGRHEAKPQAGGEAPAASMEQVMDEEHESRQYLQAYDWATARNLTSIPECPRATDAYRGCLAAALKLRKKLEAQGSAWAQINRPRRASDCKGQANFVLGCRTYYFRHLQKPKPAGQGRYEGMTTAECKKEANANFEVARELYLQEGNAHGAEVRAQRSWLPELKDCENYDRLAQSKWMPAVYDRLQGLIDRMKAGGSVTPQERDQVRKDFSAMAAIEDQPYRAAYFRNADEYFSLLDGSYRKPPPRYAHMSCEAFGKKIDKMAALDDKRVAEMQTLKRSGGLIVDGARYDAINQQRIAMLWEWKYITDGAKAAGCEQPAKPAERAR